MRRPNLRTVAAVAAAGLYAGSAFAPDPTGLLLRAVALVVAIMAGLATILRLPDEQRPPELRGKTWPWKRHHHPDEEAAIREARLRLRPPPRR